MSKQHVTEAKATTGKEVQSVEKCKQCRGTGVVTLSKEESPLGFAHPHECPECIHAQM